MEEHQLVRVVEDQLVQVGVHTVRVEQVLVVGVDEVHVEEEYLQVVGVQEDVVVGHGLEAEDVQEEVIPEAVGDQEVDGVPEEVVGFILGVDTDVAQEDGLIQNQEEVGDIAEHNLLC